MTIRYLDPYVRLCSMLESDSHCSPFGYLKAQVYIYIYMLINIYIYIHIPYKYVNLFGLPCSGLMRFGVGGLRSMEVFRYLGLRVRGLELRLRT